MDINTMIRELEYEAKKHSNDRVDTFGTNITAMCYEVANKLKVVLEVKDELNKWVDNKSNNIHSMDYNGNAILTQFSKLIEKEFNKL